MPALIAETIGAILGVLLFATILSWGIRKLTSMRTVVADAISAALVTFAAPAAYNYNHDGAVGYWGSAPMYFIGGIVAFLVMYWTHRGKAAKLPS